MWFCTSCQRHDVLMFQHMHDRPCQTHERQKESDIQNNGVESAGNLHATCCSYLTHKKEDSQMPSYENRHGMLSKLCPTRTTARYEHTRRRRNQARQASERTRITKISSVYHVIKNQDNDKILFLSFVYLCIAFTTPHLLFPYPKFLVMSQGT